MLPIIIKTLTQATMWANEGRRKLTAGAGVAALVMTSPAFAVDFSLNFQPTQSLWSESQTTGFCSLAAASCLGHDFGNGDPTPFELTVQNIGGTYYFHTLVGDPANGFAVESYTRMAGGPNGSTAGVISDQGGAFSPDAGGNETAFIGNPTVGFDPPRDGSSAASYMTSATNMVNPLAGQHVSGSGTADPTKTVFRMVMTDAKGDMSMEVVKPFLEKKPRISQTIQDGAMSSSFVADMTAISYSDMNSPVPMVNTLQVNDPALGSAGNFDMSLSQHSRVSAGRFTYTPGAGWNNPDGWDTPNSSFDAGSYTYYSGGGFDPLSFDWASNFHFNENALSCTRAPPDPTRIRSGMNGGSSCPGAP